MADGVFNIAKGEVNEFSNRIAANDPANSAFVIVILQAVVADAVLEDFDDLLALLADAGNTEATFTNYTRRELTDADINPAVVDDTNNRKDSDFPDQTYTAAGGTLDNNLVKLLVCYDADTGAGTDTNIIPVTFHDFVFVTNGSDLIAQVDSIGFFSGT